MFPQGTALEFLVAYGVEMIRATPAPGLDEKSVQAKTVRAVADESRQRKNDETRSKSSETSATDNNKPNMKLEM